MQAILDQAKEEGKTDHAGLRAKLRSSVSISRRGHGNVLGRGGIGACWPFSNSTPASA